MCEIHCFYAVKVWEETRRYRKRMILFFSPETKMKTEDVRRRDTKPLYLFLTHLEPEFPCTIWQDLLFTILCLLVLCRIRGCTLCLHHSSHIWPLVSDLRIWTYPPLFKVLTVSSNRIDPTTGVLPVITRYFFRSFVPTLTPVRKHPDTTPEAWSRTPTTSQGTSQKLDPHYDPWDCVWESPGATV